MALAHDAVKGLGLPPTPPAVRALQHSHSHPTTTTTTTTTTKPAGKPGVQLATQPPTGSPGRRQRHTVGKPRAGVAARTGIVGDARTPAQVACVSVLTEALDFHTALREDDAATAHAYEVMEADVQTAVFEEVARRQEERERGGQAPQDVDAFFDGRKRRQSLAAATEARVMHSHQRRRRSSVAVGAGSGAGAATAGAGATAAGNEAAGGTRAAGAGAGTAGGEQQAAGSHTHAGRVHRRSSGVLRRRRALSVAGTGAPKSLAHIQDPTRLPPGSRVAGLAAELLATLPRRGDLPDFEPMAVPAPASAGLQPGMRVPHTAIPARFARQHVSPVFGALDVVLDEQALGVGGGGGSGSGSGSGRGGGGGGGGSSGENGGAGVATRGHMGAGAGVGQSAKVVPITHSHAHAHNPHAGSPRKGDVAAPSAAGVGLRVDSAGVPQWKKQLFPSAAPASRAEVIELAKVADTMLREVYAKREAASQTAGPKPTAAVTQAQEHGRAQGQGQGQGQGHGQAHGQAQGQGLTQLEQQPATDEPQIEAHKAAGPPRSVVSDATDVGAHNLIDGGRGSGGTRRGGRRNSVNPLQAELASMLGVGGAQSASPFGKVQTTSHTLSLGSIHVNGLSPSKQDPAADSEPTEAEIRQLLSMPVHAAASRGVATSDHVGRAAATAGDQADGKGDGVVLGFAPELCAELSVWSIIMFEIVRHVFVACEERGTLLERARLRIFEILAYADRYCHEQAKARLRAEVCAKRLVFVVSTSVHSVVVWCV